MTREEAIKILKALNLMMHRPDGTPVFDGCEAIDMAIDDIERWRTWSHTYDNLIRREDAIEALAMLPSADAEDRLYIKIYADDEPSVKAEKLYQICGETQNREVAEWLKEYFPSAEPKTGKWDFDTVIPIGGGAYSAGYRCSNCGANYFKVEGMNFCPNCGAKMNKGGDKE